MHIGFAREREALLKWREYSKNSSTSSITVIRLKRAGYYCTMHDVEHGRVNSPMASRA